VSVTPAVQRAREHARWKNRPVQSQAVARTQSREAIARMADDLDQARRALTDLALGIVCVKVQTSPGRYDQPTREQATNLASDPVLLPALLAEDLARIYAIPPDVAALKLFMGYVMGATPTANEALLLAEVEETHRKQAYLAEVLSEYVPADKYPQVAAQLRRLAAGGDLESDG
jgi:hypothetical protein